MKIMKKIISFAVFLCILSMSCVSAYTYTPTVEPESESVYMVNKETGEVVYAKNEDKVHNPAYLSQVMTAVVVLENCSDLEAELAAPSYVFDELYNQGLNTADIRQGEVLSVQDLLYAMMVQSSCEAASILADYVGNGNISTFVDMMNKKASEIGCENTNFATPHGMLSDENKTTAKDFYLIYDYALNVPGFEDMAKSTRYTISENNKHTESRTLVTYSYLIDYYNGGTYYYKYAVTAKSSGTKKTDRALASSATYGDYNYIIVSFGAPMYDENDDYITNIGSFTDHKSLYNWAFETLKVTKVLSKEDTITEVKVKLSKTKDYLLLYPDKDYSVLLSSDVSVDSIQYIKDIPDSVNAPVKKGDVIGTMTLRLKNEDLVTVNLVAGEAIAADGVIRSAYLIGVVLTSPWFLAALAVVLVGVIGLVIYARVHNKNRRKYKTVRHKRRF